MARIEIKKMLPFTTYDAAKKYGRCDDEVYGVIELETAKSKVGFEPFRCRYTWLSRESRHTTIDEALAEFNQQIAAKARVSGWTPENEA